MIKGLVAPTNLKIDFKPSARQYEVWKMLQPNYCPICGGQIEERVIGVDKHGDEMYAPVCNKCGNDNIPQLILAGGAAGKRNFCQPIQ